MSFPTSETAGKDTLDGFDVPDEHIPAEQLHTGETPARYTGGRSLPDQWILDSYTVEADDFPTAAGLVRTLRTFYGGWELADGTYINEGADDGGTWHVSFLFQDG